VGNIKNIGLKKAHHRDTATDAMAMKVHADLR
jgi:hypothetical protein